MPCDAIQVSLKIFERYARPPSGSTTATIASAIVDPARDLERGVHGEAARAADEHALRLGQPARGEEAVAVGDAHVAVDHRRVVGRRPEVLPHALDQVRVDLVAGVDRADGVGADHDEVGVLLAQVARHAGDRPAGADADDEVRQAAPGLAPQLRPGRLVVRLRVGRVAVLVGLERARDLLGQAVGDAVVGLRRLRRRRRSARSRPRRRRRAAGRSSRATSCPASRRSRGSPSAARRSRGRCRCCPTSAR